MPLDLAAGADDAGRDFGISGGDLATDDGGSGPCVDGAVDVQACGNCGTMQRQCVAGAWQPFGPCNGQGECSPGTTQSVSCGASVGACKPGTESRTCWPDCSWSGWSACGGSYVGPTPEICGDGVDNNCNGTVDEGCACSPADVGHGGSFALAGAIIKMISDPNPASCIVYALDQSATPHLFVIDTKNKTTLATVTLPYGGDDVAISPNGQYLVVGHVNAQKLSVIDKSTWTVANTIAAATYVNQIAAENHGLVYYNAVSNYEQTHRIDLVTGSASDSTIGTTPGNFAVIALTRDGNYLYSGDTGITGANMRKYDLTSGAAMQADISIWAHGYGFPDPTPPMLLSPNEQHLYYGGYQLAAGNLARVTGATGEHVFAEDAAGTFAVGENYVFDAQLALKLAKLPVTAAAAALAASDREIWFWSHQNLYYRNVDDFLAGVPLGVRPRPAAPLSGSTITRIVADPVRPRVYALDASQQLVIAVDTTNGLVVGGIIVGSLPSDIAISPSGATLWIAHEGVLGLGKIDLASWQFSGFVPLPIDSYRVATIGDAWVAAIDYDQWTSPTLVNAVSGAVTDSINNSIFEGSLCGTPDGKTLFVGDSGLTSDNVYRYDVSTGKLVQQARSHPNGPQGFPSASREIACASDGSFLFYAGYSIEGTGLVTLNYAEPDQILSITPDKRLALSATMVYRASDGQMLGALPTTAALQAPSSDGKRLYVVSGGALQTVDLTKY
jgi:DNA-binding beta-propeller fold protein YncE